MGCILAGLSPSGNAVRLPFVGKLPFGIAFGVSDWQPIHVADPTAFHWTASMNIPEPKFAINTMVNGKHYGRFAIVGRRWSDSVGEYIYGVFQVDENQNIVSREMNLVESCFE